MPHILAKPGRRSGVASSGHAPPSAAARSSLDPPLWPVHLFSVVGEPPGGARRQHQAMRHAAREHLSPPSRRVVHSRRSGSSRAPPGLTFSTTRGVRAARGRHQQAQRGQSGSAARPRRPASSAVGRFAEIHPWRLVHAVGNSRREKWSRRGHRTTGVAGRPSAQQAASAFPAGSRMNCPASGIRGCLFLPFQVAEVVAVHLQRLTAEPRRSEIRRGRRSCCRTARRAAGGDSRRHHANEIYRASRSSHRVDARSPQAFRRPRQQAQRCSAGPS